MLIVPKMELYMYLVKKSSLFTLFILLFFLFNGCDNYIINPELLKIKKKVEINVDSMFSIRDSTVIKYENYLNQEYLDENLRKNLFVQFFGDFLITTNEALHHSDFITAIMFFCLDDTYETRKFALQNLKHKLKRIKKNRNQLIVYETTFDIYFESLKKTGNSSKNKEEYKKMKELLLIVEKIKNNIESILAFGDSFQIIVEKEFL